MFIVGVAATAQDAPKAAPSRFEGQTIRAIRFNPPEQPITADEFSRILPLHIGSPLHLDDVRTALAKLYSTGRFADVSIDAEPLADGVELRISTEFTYFVGGVDVDGAIGFPSRAQLLAASKLELGAPFDASQMGQAVENMQERLQANGLRLGSIQYHL